ncbi:Alpha/Beta hydrolase protein [Xylariomycetidae sp. FL2044]|nr:Alpha/Beta hydrolase protein [Xylariomycetidae sp. FL2044]
MGQGPSREAVELETRVEDPQDGNRPEGLALIAHGRWGGTSDQPPVRLLAEYLCNHRRLRVVTWNSRGAGQTGGGSLWTAWGSWEGDADVDDYQRRLHKAMDKYTQDFPDAQQVQLFICGYSAGAICASCARPPPSFTRFSPARYILISYPVELSPVLSLSKSGSYFRSVEALVQGRGWENLPSEFDGREPEVAGVLTISAQHDTYAFYSVWAGILWAKNARNVLSHVVVEGAGHAWEGKAPRIVDEVDKWLVESGVA